MINPYTDTELEELAAIHMEKIRLLMMSYSSIYAEGVKRQIKSFMDSGLTLLSQEEKIPVAEYIKSLDSQALVDHVYRYKEMPTCLKITLAEIAKRLSEN